MSSFSKKSRGSSKKKKEQRLDPETLRAIHIAQPFNNASYRFRSSYGESNFTS